MLLTTFLGLNLITTNMRANSSPLNYFFHAATALNIMYPTNITLVISNAFINFEGNLYFHYCVINEFKEQQFFNIIKKVGRE